MLISALHLPSSGGVDYPANNAAFIQAGQMADWVMNNPVSLLPILALPVLVFLLHKPDRKATTEG